MKKIFISFLFLGSSMMAMAQEEDVVIKSGSDGWKKIYRASATKINDLVHTKLDVTPDYKKCYLYGKEWVTLKPHFYPTDSLNLDAKGMNINEVAIIKNGKKIPLKYVYKDSLNLLITLDKTYTKNEQYTVYIDYTSKPNEFKVHGSAAITDAKGLYFINPDGKDPNKPIQLWTQGETEGSSVWFPTIDRPDQKTTDEIILTVPAKFVSLSNGKLVSSKNNSNGTRTDYWKMDLPHSPYLFFFGVGDYAVIKDKYKNKEVNYYVEHEYAPVARKIFGNTPEMMTFYSKILGIDYPWNKYSQMTARDYVSGAMENTTATLHTDALQQNARQLVDGNKYEEYVAHELFHQWFGDLVTCESWSNLTVNESFANYSETLWDTYKYGKDAGDKQNYEDMVGYLRSNSGDLDLVRFYYKDKEDMFDAVSYNKGGRILHMLRHYVGDSAFFNSLNLYLNQNKFGNGEAHQLRLAFEQVTGQDMNWFWNQWYFGSGNPDVNIKHKYDAAKGTETVTISQIQRSGKAFELPIDIDIYVNGQKTRHSVWAKKKEETYTFPVSSKPDLVNVDGDKIMLWSKKEDKNLDEYNYQFDHAGKYLDRREAIHAAFADTTGSAVADEIKKKGLSDKFYDIREKTLESYFSIPNPPFPDVVTVIEKIATNDPERKVRAAAIAVLGKFVNKKYEPLFDAGVKDSSYSVAGASLVALSKIDQPKALALLPEMRKDMRADLKDAVDGLAIYTYGDDDFDRLYDELKNINLYKGVETTFNFITFLGNVKKIDNFKKGLDLVLEKREKYAPLSQPLADNLTASLKGLLDKKQQDAISDASIKPEVEYLESKLK
ncbi:MAG: peptidase M1 [Pseudopedobacter saltans]|uniref:Aminopeptidase N n=1 Tax=Pseudopedobacter saltans TaxID=151895 RepID=A0A2W5F5L4_9SPHI|nr:MAG: peptidase M1 [Pseudopedobacter saltans]